ncbi:MAG: thioredoxin fold domain-containing protein, partial [Gammaproteobacteria bacterium]|nr:thioredoxin fold domain-containing protein [Gammaproteobacteria bacterium]
MKTAVWMSIAGLLGLVQPAMDLQQTGQLARDRQLPVLLYVSRSDCTFCRRFEAEVLNPLLRSGAIAGKIVIRELVWDLPQPVTDFAGREVSRASLAQAYQAKLTPTLLFLDADGQEITARITGYPRSDYFSYYLEAAVAEAAAAIR